jgi:pimeloyl-ACP methyl ester carboxylesterase
MLHGWLADHLCCVRILEPIFKQRSGWKRIYPDLPGMGKTPGKEWITKQDDVLDVILNFITSVVPGQNVSIAGFSYGGYLAQGVVYQKSALVNGVLLLAPHTGVDERERSLPKHIILVEDKVLTEEFKDYFGRAIKMADQEFVSRLKDNFAFSFDVRVLPEPFDRPALILTGRHDSELGYRDAWDILENYPRATFAILDRAGHPLPYEQEHLLHVLVDEWLDRVEENTSS